MNINNSVNLMMARSGALRQAKTRAFSRAGRSNTSGRISGNYRGSIKDYVNNSSGGSSSVSNMQKRSNYTMIVKSAEDLQEYASKLLQTGPDSLFGKANPAEDTADGGKTEESGKTPEGTEESDKTENKKPTEEELEQYKKDVVGYIQKFVNEYNDMMDRLGRVNDSSSNFYIRELKSYVTQNKFQLSNMGITQQADGSLKVDSKKLMETDIEKIQKQFGEKGSFADQVKGMSKNVCSSAKAQLEKLSSSVYYPSSNYNRYGSALLPHQMKGSYYSGLI